MISVILKLEVKSNNAGAQNPSNMTTDIAPVVLTLCPQRVCSRAADVCPAASRVLKHHQRNLAQASGHDQLMATKSPTNRLAEEAG